MIDRIAAILDQNAFSMFPWENPNSEHFGAAYVIRYPHPSAIEKRRRIARAKAKKIVELFNRSNVGKSDE